MTKATPMVRKVARTVESQLFIQHPKSGSELLAIPAHGNAQHGKTPTFRLIDEIHAWSNRKLWKALKTAMAKVPTTLMVIITTAGRGQETLAHDEYKYAGDIATGKIDNPAYLPVIFEPPEKYNWRDEKIWSLVNPGLKQGFPDLAGMRSQAKEIENKPADRADFQQYNLNSWLDHSEQPFIEMSIWDLGDEPVNLDDLKDKPCWVGVDLAPTNDLSNVAAC